MNAQILTKTIANSQFAIRNVYRATGNRVSPAGDLAVGVACWRHLLSTGNANWL
jgi:hypothetical protein